jgi:hypothetical protein
MSSKITKQPFHINFDDAGGEDPIIESSLAHHRITGFNNFVSYIDTPPDIEAVLNFHLN